MGKKFLAFLEAEISLIEGILGSIYRGSIYIAYILLRTPSTNDISASRNARKFFKKTN